MKMREEFVPEKTRHVLTSGRTVALLRDLKGWTQEELAKRANMSATNISAIENDRVEIGKKRAVKIAEAFEIHPAVIMFPEYVAPDSIAV